MKNLKSFTVTLQNFRNSQYGASIEVFVNESGETCLQVPQEELLYYRGKVVNAGYSFSHLPLKTNFITLNQSVENIENVELLLKRLNIHFEKVIENELKEVCHVS